MRHMQVSMAENQLPDRGIYKVHMYYSQIVILLKNCDRKRVVQVEYTLASIKSNRLDHSLYRIYLKVVNFVFQPILSSHCLRYK